VSDSLAFTGERFIPGAPGEIWYEHWHRYHFAAPLVAGRRVLDVACGSGYGSALLAAGAASVTGVDLAPAAIAQARARYAAIGNLEFVAADCTTLPLASGSVDAVVSFETLEHIHGQEAFLDEVARVLAPDGLLVLSCPNKLEYSDKRDAANEFHVRELYRDELAAMLAPRFAHSAWYGQRMSFFSLIWPDAPAQHARMFEVGEDDAAAATPGHSRPLYFIVLASRRAETVQRIAPTLSVLADRQEWVYGDYARTMRNERSAWDRGNTLELEVTAWQGHFGEAVRQRDELRAVVDAHDRVLAAERAEQEHLAADIATLKVELERRERWRWWLGWPLRRILRR
jgi:SAM-dependent methyltransferase